MYNSSQVYNTELGRLILIVAARRKPTLYTHMAMLRVKMAGASLFSSCKAITKVKATDDGTRSLWIRRQEVPSNKDPHRQQS